MDEISWSFYASAVLTGLGFGYVSQRGGFCLTRALANLYIMGDPTIVRAYLLALLVATIGTHLLLALGVVQIPIRPFHWLANLLGGLLFGVGMILSGGALEAPGTVLGRGRWEPGSCSWGLPWAPPP